MAPKSAAKSPKTTKKAKGKLFLSVFHNNFINDYLLYVLFRVLSYVPCYWYRYSTPLVPSLPALSAAPKEKRAPSAYNTFMKTEVEKVKKANPSLKPAEAFKAAALNVRKLKKGKSLLLLFSFSGRTLLKTLRSNKLIYYWLPYEMF